MCLPKKLVRTLAAVLLTQAWADGYSGWSGVGRKGVQAGSASVASLPSVSARGMAVTGRQNRYVYLLSQQAMLASTMARFSRANSRTFSTSPVRLWADTVRATRFHIGSDGSASHSAIWVCSAVRSALFTLPSRLVSLKSAAHSSLFRLGGPSARNWSPRLSTNGVTKRQAGMLGFPNVGGVRWYSPGPLPKVYVPSTSDPSVLRRATI